MNRLINDKEGKLSDCNESLSDMLEYLKSILMNDDENIHIRVGRALARIDIIKEKFNSK